jgi:hypothetical protein
MSNLRDFSNSSLPLRLVDWRAILIPGTSEISVFTFNAATRAVSFGMARNNQYGAFHLLWSIGNPPPLDLNSYSTGAFRSSVPVMKIVVDDSSNDPFLQHEIANKPYYTIRQGDFMHVKQWTQFAPSTTRFILWEYGY